MKIPIMWLSRKARPQTVSEIYDPNITFEDGWKIIDFRRARPGETVLTKTGKVEISKEVTDSPLLIVTQGHSKTLKDIDAAYFKYLEDKNNE